LLPGSSGYLSDGHMMTGPAAAIGRKKKKEEKKKINLISQKHDLKNEHRRSC